jgi:hypothetical protein
VVVAGIVEVVTRGAVVVGSADPEHATKAITAAPPTADAQRARPMWEMPSARVRVTPWIPCQSHLRGRTASYGDEGRTATRRPAIADRVTTNDVVLRYTATCYTIPQPWGREVPAGAITPATAAGPLLRRTPTR